MRCRSASCVPTVRRNQHGSPHGSVNKQRPLSSGWPVSPPPSAEWKDTIAPRHRSRPTLVTMKLYEGPQGRRGNPTPAPRFRNDEKKSPRKPCSRLINSPRRRYSSPLGVAPIKTSGVRAASFIFNRVSRLRKPDVSEIFSVRGRRAEAISELRFPAEP